MAKSSKPLAILLTLPANLLLLLAIAVPSVYVGWISLHESTFGADQKFVGFDNYLAIFSDPLFWRAFVNTFIVTNVIVYVELALALALAVALSKPFRGRGIVIAILIAPYAVTEVSAVIMWRYLFDIEIGFGNAILQTLFGTTLQWATNPAHGLTLIAIVAIWIHLPFTFILVYSALTTVPPELKDAARAEGATELQVVHKVVLPVIAPTILVAMMFRYIFAMRLFAEVWLLTEGGPARMTEVLGVYLFRAAFRYYDFGVAAATGIAMQLLSMAIAFFYLLQLYRGMKVNAR